MNGNLIMALEKIDGARAWNEKTGGTLGTCLNFLEAIELSREIERLMKIEKEAKK